MKLSKQSYKSNLASAKISYSFDLKHFTTLDYSPRENFKC